MSVRHTKSELDDMSASEVRAIAEELRIEYTSKRETVPKILAHHEAQNASVEPTPVTTKPPVPAEPPAPRTASIVQPPTAPGGSTAAITGGAPQSKPISQARIDMLTALNQPFCRSCGQTRSTDRNGKQVCPNGTPTICSFS